MAAEAALDRGRTPIWLAAIVPVVSLLILTGVRIVRQPKLNFDENIFLDVGRHIVDTGLPWRTWAFEEPRLFFDHTPLYVYFVAARDRARRADGDPASIGNAAVRAA